MTAHPWTDLPVLMSRLDECLAAAVPHARARYGVGPGADPYRGLYIGDDTVERLVGQPVGGAALADGIEWPTIADSFVQLDTFDSAVVMLALGPEVDLKYERIYGYLQDDVTARRPRVALALDLFCSDLQSRLAARDRFSPDASLRREGILRLDDGGDMPLLARSIRLEPHVVRHLLGGTGVDERVAARCTVIASQADSALVPLPASDRAALDRLGERVAGGRPVRVVLSGSDAGLLDELAAELAARAELTMLRTDAGADRAFMQVVAIESRLLGYALHVTGVDDLSSLYGAGQLTVVTTDRPVHEVEGLGFEVVAIGRPDAAARRECWARRVPDLSDSDLDRLAARYRLSSTQIGTAARAAGDASFADLAAAARRQAGRRLAGLTTRIDPVATWDDLVLDDAAVRALHELCDRVAQRQTVLRQWGMDRRTNGRLGVNALFAGPSGTGKTTAAQVVARELGLDLAAIDLSSVVSKYIGETEKNLDAIFVAAETSDAVLLFDEADALFGKRSEVRDSHDRYANLEVSYLLQRMEAHDGVAILATNLRQNLDDAFLRRIGCVIRFPFPDDAQRRRIWERIWPASVPLGTDIDLDALARYKFAGGNIRNIALCAAYLAAAAERAVTWVDVLAAVDREYDKLGGGVAPTPRLAAVPP